MRIRPASQLERRAISWLWPGRLALGKLAMLDGDPGLGKSLLALDLCARLTTGRPWPDGSAGPGVGNAVVLNGEDGGKDTVVPRLEALGADLERVFVLDQDDDLSEPLRLPEQTARLEEVLAHTQARLLVLDPVVAFLGPGVATASDASVRRALYPLARLAEKHSCAELLVRHLNKTGDDRALYRGGGSIGFLAACRSGWLAARDPEAAGRCVLAQVKNNLAPPQPSLMYEVRNAAGAAPVLSWLGPCARTADELLAGKATELLGPVDRARAFLKAFLAGGPRTTQDIWAAAEPDGFSPRTLQRARRQLGIRYQQAYVDGRRVSHWLLRGQRLPAAAGVPDLEQWIAPLLAQYPGPSPLDEGEE